MHYQLHPRWFNTIRSGVLFPQNFSRKLWKKYRILHLYIPEPEYVLVQKMLVNRPKDRGDIKALLAVLGITTRAQAQGLFDRYLAKDEQESRNVDVLLRSYFSMG